MKRHGAGFVRGIKGGFGGKWLTQVVLAGKNISGDTGESASI